MTFGEMCENIKELREQRSLYSRIIAESVIENDEEAVKSFTDKYKRISDVINYYSAIEVEFENKYATED
jgi:hypothetical protein